MTVNIYFQLTLYEGHGLAMALLQAVGLVLCFLTLGLAMKEHSYLRYACLCQRGKKREATGTEHLLPTRLSMRVFT